MLETPDEVDPAFRADVIAGLAEPIPSIPARWLYDLRGSELFDDITRLDAYYPTRTETALLKAKMPEIAALVGRDTAIVEFGSGSSTKTPLLLDAVKPCAYVPIDISGDYLRESAARVDAQFPKLPVHPVEADFTKEVILPAAIDGLARLGFFPGSTIGNFVARSAVDLLRAMKETLGEGSRLVIGMDRIKDVDTLIRAYDDEAGVTAAFNLNLLHRINRELGADIPVDAFRHLALWNDDKGRIEMHLEAVRDTAFAIDGTPFAFKAGETIHTENSHKYGLRDSRLLLRAAGWGVVEQWTDAEERFAMILAESEAPRFAP